MILTIIYALLCYGFTMGVDDEKKWGFLDWVILIFSPVIAPFILGRMIGKVVYEISKLNEI